MLCRVLARSYTSEGAQHLPVIMDSLILSIYYIRQLDRSIINTAPNLYGHQNIGLGVVDARLHTGDLMTFNGVAAAAAQRPRTEAMS